MENIIINNDLFNEEEIEDFFDSENEVEDLTIPTSDDELTEKYSKSVKKYIDFFEILGIALIDISKMYEISLSQKTLSTAT